MIREINISSTKISLEVSTMVVPLSAIPAFRDGFYAVNNQFLSDGPKGFTEFRILENNDLFVRIDLPGVPQEGLKIFLDPTKKAVIVFADAPKEHKHDSSPRKYGTTTGLVCSCCEISGFTSLMSDGVLRLILTKKPVNIQRPSCISCLRDQNPQGRRGTDPNDPALTGRILQPHPCVNLGSEMAYESKQLQNGGLYVRLDMPGVPKEKFRVSVKNGKVRVMGEAPAVGYDSGARVYDSDVAILSTPVDVPNRKIKTIAKHGVIRLTIPPI